MPLLEERCPKGGVVASYRTMTSTPIFLHPSVDFVDSSPRWEPYMPLLEERCPKGGVVVSYRTMTSTPISSPPSVDFVDSSPLWEPYMPLLEERCPKGGVVVSCGTAPLTSLFSTTVGDQWSPLRQYYTVPKFKKEKSVTSLFYYSPYLTP